MGGDYTAILYRKKQDVNTFVYHPRNIVYDPRMATIKQRVMKLRSLEQRRREMARLRRDKVTLDAIGKRYGITRQRVWAILKG